MCLIIVKKSGINLPRQEWLDTAEKQNPDGIGIMFKKADKNEVTIKKDFVNSTTLGIWLKDNIAKEDTLIIHFRFATHGAKDVGNRHPFPVSKDKILLRSPEVICSMGLAHNGILSQHTGHVKFSDTQKFVLGIMSDDAIKHNLNSVSVRKLISEYIGSDKLAILTSEGCLYLWGEYVTDDGLLFSNTGYLEARKTVQLGWWNKSSQKIDDGYFAVCDGCKDKLFVRPIEVKIGGVVYLNDYCKKCRKKIRKGTFIKNNEKVTIASESDYEVCESEGKDAQCNNCFDWFPKNEMVITYYGNVCRRCSSQLW